MLTSNKTEHIIIPRNRKINFNLEGIVQGIAMNKTLVNYFHLVNL